MSSSQTEARVLIDVSDVVDILARLQLGVISQDYVDQVMSSQYSYYKFPESYESIVMPDIDFPSIINDSCELLNIYLQQPSAHILWDQFFSDDSCYVHPKPLSCLLNCYIHYGLKCIDEPSSRKNGLSATRLFFLASTFMGSKNIGFYHISILTKCTELVKSCIAMLNFTGGINSGDDVQLEEDEKIDLIADLLSIVRAIGIMVKRFQFFDEISSLDMIIDIMIDVTHLERNSGNILEQVPTENLSYGTLAFNAYAGLTDMFNDNCGSTLVIGQKLMHCMVLGLLVDGQREMQLTTRQFNAIRDHHLSFLRKITRKLGSPFERVLEILLQHLLHRGPERSELRPRQFQIILEVWRLCPNNVRIKTKYYLLRLVYDVDVKLRIVALETLFKLLSEPEEIEPEDPTLLQLMPATKHEFIVAVILSKFEDFLLTVRSKAFSLFATLTAGPPTATAHQTALVKRVLVDPYLKFDNLNHTSFCKKDFHDFHQYLENDMANFDPNNISNLNIYPGAKILLWILNVHARDERAYIRRISLTVLCNLFLINNKFMEKYYLTLLVSSCSDNAMTIRKVAVSGLTDLILKYPDNQDVLKYWFKGLIHLVGDRDKKIQELAVESMNRVILNNIKPYSPKIIDGNDPLDYLPWRVLDNVLNEKVGKYMMCLCEKWRINGFLTDRNVKDIMTYVGSSNHGWTVHSLYLLQLISHQLTISNISPLVKYFDTQFDLWFVREENPSELNILLTHAQMTIDILFLNHNRLDKETRQRLLNTFEDLLFNFKIPTRLISKSLDLYTVLQLNNSEKLNTNLRKLFQTICNYIETSTNIDNEEIIIRYIYTLGDIGLVQHLQIKHKFQQYLLGFLGKTDESVSSALQTIVILTVGKLSIVDEQFAKEAIVQYGAILKNPYHPSIKINALTALADLCLRCTTLVEQAIPEMCVCLKAESVPVKRVALKLLTGLILEDYIKLRDVAFFALLCMLEDPDDQVRQETSSFIVNYLLIKNKDIMERKLIEVIFHFNGYTGVRASGVEDCFTNPELKAFFSMEGDSKKASRHCVYRFMLTHMLDDNKLKLMVKIFNIFEEVVKDVRATANNDVRERATQVMRDAFWILKAKEMALASGKPRDTTNDDDPGTLEKVADLAKQRVIMETYKMVMTDYIIPGVLKLKYELEKNKKKLPTVMNDLRAYLCALTSGKSPIKAEIVELLSVDNDLIAEILHENRQMKQHNKHLDGENGVGELESEDDDDDDDPATHLMQDLEYVTWAQTMQMREKAEESGMDVSTQAQMEEEIQQKASEISIYEDDLQDVAAANFSQLTGEVTVRPINSDKKTVSNETFAQMSISKNNSAVKLSAEKKQGKKLSKNHSTSTDLDDENLPAYKLFD